MDLDPYMFFTGCHRLYVQGVRRALRQRLESAYGEEWWEKGVVHALMPEQAKNLQIDVDRNPDRERHLLLDAAHFSTIIGKHHNAVFSDAFPNSVQVTKDLRRLAVLRNEWAHIQHLPFAQAKQAAEVMMHVLASLRCAEALEVEQMSRDFVFEPEVEAAGGSIEDLDQHGLERDALSLGATPLDTWHRLQSYLVLEQSVVLPEGEADGQARISLRAHNTAPDSKDLPSIVFNSVRLRTPHGRSIDWGTMRPGQTREAEFAFPAKGLLAVEFKVVGEIDTDELRRFARTTTLPENVVAPLQREFLRRFRSIGVGQFVASALEVVEAPIPSMTIADIAGVRELLKKRAQQIEGKREELGKLTQEFQLDRESILGARTREVVLALVEFEEKVDALDQAIGRTDLEAINAATEDLKQMQLAVLRVEGAVSAMGAD